MPSDSSKKTSRPLRDSDIPRLRDHILTTLGTAPEKLLRQVVAGSVSSGYVLKRHIPVQAISTDVIADGFRDQKIDSRSGLPLVAKKPYSRALFAHADNSLFFWQRTPSLKVAYSNGAINVEAISVKDEAQQDEPEYLAQSFYRFVFGKDAHHMEMQTGEDETVITLSGSNSADSTTNELWLSSTKHSSSISVGTPSAKALTPEFTADVTRELARQKRVQDSDLRTLALDLGRVSIDPARNRAEALARYGKLGARHTMHLASVFPGLRQQAVLRSIY